MNVLVAIAVLVAGVDATEEVFDEAKFVAMVSSLINTQPLTADQYEIAQHTVDALRRNLERRVAPRELLDERFNRGLDELNAQLDRMHNMSVRRWCDRSLAAAYTEDACQTAYREHTETSERWREMYMNFTAWIATAATGYIIYWVASTWVSCLFKLLA